MKLLLEVDGAAIAAAETATHNLFFYMQDDYAGKP